MAVCCGSDRGEDPPDEPTGNRPACAREETYAEPNADLVDIDFGGHVRFSLSDEEQKGGQNYTASQ